MNDTGIPAQQAVSVQTKPVTTNAVDAGQPSTMKQQPPLVASGGQPVPSGDLQDMSDSVGVSSLGAQHQSTDEKKNEEDVHLISGGDKERVEFGPSLSEQIPVVELKETHEMEPEVESWVEKIEKDSAIQMHQPIQDDDGDVILADAGSVVQEDKILLPVTETEFQTGMQMKVTESARWLAEWVKKLMKQMGNEAMYRNT